MNLFRSEEHIRTWTRFDPSAEEGILPLKDLVEMFSKTLFTKRMDPDYVSRSREYVAEWLSELSQIGRKRPFWMPEPH